MMWSWIKRTTSWTEELGGPCGTLPDGIGPGICALFCLLGTSLSCGLEELLDETQHLA